MTGTKTINPLPDPPKKRKRGRPSKKDVEERKKLEVEIDIEGIDVDDEFLPPSKKLKGKKKMTV